MSNKVKLFIFSNTYVARVLLRCLEHIKQNDDFEVILLSELGVTNNINLKINIYETLQQCIEACTQVLIVHNDKIPKAKIDLVSSLANLHNKCCTIVPGFQDIQQENSSEKYFNQSINKKPLILIVSYGTRTQISCWETIIYKLLVDNNFKVSTFFSSELKDVFNCLELCDMASQSYNNNFVIESKSEIEIRCVEYDLNENNGVNDILFRINPDVMIISIGNNYNDYTEIANIFKYKYGKKVDIFAKSELIDMIDDEGDRKIIFDFSSFHNEKNLTLYLNDPLLFKHLSNVILPKISLPSGVTIV